MKNTAKIYTYSIIYSPSEEFKDKVPYVVAVLEKGNERFSSLIEGYRDGMEVRIGMPVTYCKDDDAGNPIYVF